MVGWACATGASSGFKVRVCERVRDACDGDGMLRTKRVPRDEAPRGFVGSGWTNSRYVELAPRRPPRLFGCVADRFIPIGFGRAAGG